MTDKIQLIKTFINLLDGFLSDLEISFPQEKEIKVTKASLKMASMINPRMIVEEFVKYITPYKPQLFNKDHHFFMDLSNFDLDQSSMMKGIKIIDLLKSSDSDNTEVIFNYMQKLFRLGEKIVV
jgi:hypothetical protein